MRGEHTVMALIEKWDLLTLNEVTISVRLLLALACGGVLGFERTRKRRPAGLRTYMLVCVGAAVIMMTAQFMHQIWGGDLGRLPAQVISGIGFLGAGVIIQTGTTVKGLTTAATLWMSMSIGLACGSGNFTIAILGTFLAIICLIAFIPLEKLANKRNPIIFISIPVNTSPVKEIIQIATKYSITINNFESFITTFDGQDAIRMVVRINKVKKSDLNDFIDELQRKIDIYEIKVA